MLDPQDEQFDRRLARHLVSLYHQSQQDEEEEELVSFYCMTISQTLISLL